MTITWIGDEENETVARVDNFALRAWLDGQDWNWTLGLENGPVARGFADTLQGAKDAATEALEDFRSGALQ
jgi:hypothetical protein